MTDTVEDTKVTEEAVEERTEEQIAENLYGDKSEKQDETLKTDEPKEESDKETQQDETKAEQEETADEKKPQELVLELSKDSPLDQTYVDAVLEYAKENGKTQEEASEILLHKEDAVLDHISDQDTKMNLEADAGLKMLASDPLLGGDNFEKSQELARKPLNDERFVSKEDRPALMEFLEKTRLQDNPIFFKMLNSMGKAMSDASYLKDGAPVARKKTMEERWYGDKAATKE